MARYTIDGQILTDIADAIRNQVGETKPAFDEAIYEYSYSKTINDWSDRFQVPGASKIVISNISAVGSGYYTKIAGGSYSGYSKLPGEAYTIDTLPSEMTFTGVDTISFAWKSMNAASVHISITATLTGYDENNEILVNKPVEVPRVMTPAQMSDEINNLSIIPTEKFYLTGDLTSRFSYNGWNWFIEQFGDKIITENITSLNSTFVNSYALKEIPFDLHCRISSSGASPFNQTFSGCSELIKFPNIYIHTNTASASVMLDKGINEEQNIFLDDNVSIYGFEYNAFTGATLKKEPDWLFSKCDWDQIRTNTKSEFGTGFPVEWSQAYYIKELPSFSNFYSEGTSNYYSHWYSLKLVSCYNLQNIVLPRPGKCAYSSTPNAFGNMTYLTSLKNLTFDVQEDGTPYTAQWKNTTLSLHSYIGYAYTLSYVDATKQVTNDESYQRLKNDPAYWTSDIKYACYNHDSAVATINSLPDTSAYGTNTIKFKGSAGSATDGGAINTLTEEEIAVATAKGWTVTFV